MIDVLSILSLCWLLLMGTVAHIVLLQELWMWIGFRFLEKVFSFKVAFYIALVGFFVTCIGSSSIIVPLAFKKVTTLIH